LPRLGLHLIFWGKVMLYQLSYFRNNSTQCPNFRLAKVRVLHLIFWGKVMLYQLSYFRNTPSLRST